MNETTKQELIRKRGAVKASLTALERFSETFSVEGPGDYEILASRLTRLDETLTRYNEIQFQLDEFDDQLDDRLEFENRYDKLLGHFKVIQRNNIHFQVPQANGNEFNSCTASQSNTHNHINIKLPEIHIPNFSGDFIDWLKFRDTFKAIVIDRTDLSNVAKFHYLNSSLSDEPKRLIQNLPASDDNFNVAWRLLCERYNNVRLISHNHIKSLFAPPTLQKNSAESLRCLIDHFSSHVNALQALDLNQVSIQDLLLSHMIVSVLDSATIRDWENTVATNEVPSLRDLIEFLERRCKMLQAIDKNDVSNSSSSNQKSASKGHSHSAPSNDSKCSLCKNSHRLFQCDNFKRLSIDSRLEHVKTNKLCHNCLKTYSQGHICSGRRCLQCQRTHHTLLHKPGPTQSTINTAQVNVTHSKRSSNTVPPLRATVSSSSPRELLPTARIRVRNSSGKFVTCTALLDSGSDCNLVTVRLIDRLNTPTSRAHTYIGGVNEQHSSSMETAELEISSCYNNWSSTVHCILVDSISTDLPPTSIDVSQWNIPKDIPLADTNFSNPKPVEILLGVNVFFQVLCDGRIMPPANYPVVQNTLLGWVFAGNVPTSSDWQAPRKVLSAAIVSRSHVQDQLEKFWQIEEVNTRLLTRDEITCEEHFSHTTSRNEDGRYIVKLPRKIDTPELGTSRNTTMKRFLALERRLARDPTLRKEYVEFMSEYENLGHMQLAPPPSDSECYYIPHHPVIKDSSTTTRLRVVFDASAKSSNGVSLNNTLLVGPVTQQELFMITLRFRTRKIAFAADITKMYRQVLVHPDDYDLQRIFWRTSPDEPIREYQLKTVTYGTAPASFLATRALKQLAEDEGQSFPRAASIIRTDFYVDDLISGCDTAEEAISIYNELNSLLNQGGFQLRKWSSNSERLLQVIPPTERETQSLRSFGDKDESVVKTLGLFWQPSDDKLYIQAPSLTQYANVKFTKRILLSMIAAIFDPLGLIAPIVITCKILFQSLWTAKLDWDDELPPFIHSTWSKVYQGLTGIGQIAIPRLALCSHKPVNIQLHGFCDSSEQAYGACFYLVAHDATGQVTSHLLCAKTRVAPVKKQTIPRLELCAALLLAKLLTKVEDSLDLTLNSITLWSDSTIVLAWIAAAPQRWKVFVANRVAEIQTTTSHCSWKHVRSQENPADLLSRGVTPNELDSNELWWFGPPWLTTSGEPEQSDVAVPINDATPEIKFCHVAHSSHNAQFLEKYSSYPATLRIIAFCKRFIHNCRNPTKLTGPLTRHEIEDALITCVKLVQSQHFHVEIAALTNEAPLPTKSTLLNLNPFLHSDGTLRVGGRLEKSNLPFDAKHQIILPAGHFARNLVRFSHERLLHGGISLIMADVRQRYWILSSRRLIRSVVRACLTCFRHNPRSTNQIMGNLPSVRVQQAHPFYNVGVDYTGPLTIRNGGPRSKVTSKAYIAIFICMATKAVHIEIAKALSTEAFIAVFSRFYCRRGIPSQIFSDNGSNFQGACRELNELQDLLAAPDFQRYVERATSQLLIQWHFIPPRSPHFGGLWEANIRGLKFHLRRVLSGQLLTFEELSTVTSQVEAVLNSRPISRLSEDPNDISYLTPGHFLIGRALTTLPTPDLSDVPANRLSRWQHLQHINEIFWRKWSSEYLHTLQQRTKWKTSQPNLQINTLVLIRDDDAPPLSWKLGLIHDVHPGEDGKVRVVTLRTERGLVKRSIVKICPLPIDSQEAQQTETPSENTNH